MQSDPKPPASLADRLKSMGISESYASQLKNGKRTPSMALALRIYREIGEKMGPLLGTSAAEIRVLERMANKPSPGTITDQDAAAA